MQAWQIEATSDGHVRWVPATVDRGRLSRPSPSEETLGCSMDDLLLQAWPRILGDGSASEKGEEIKLSDKECQCTVFSTGLGRSVSMSRSSIEKAKSVLEVNKDEGHVVREPKFGTLQRSSGKLASVAVDKVCKEKFASENHNTDRGTKECDVEFPMFQTGFGQLVSVKQSSVEKAFALLENQNIENTSRDGGQFQLFKTGSGQPLSVSKSSVDQARALFEEQLIDEGIGAGGLEDEGIGGCSEQHPVFKTGSGRPVLVDQSSIQKAHALLKIRNSDEEQEDVPVFSTGSGGPVFVNKESLQKSRASFGNYKNDEVNKDVPMFATGSGKPVSVKQNSLEKARVVLQNHSRDEVNEDVPMFATGLGKPVSVKQSSLEKARAVLQNHSCDEVNENVPMFATGSGKPVSVKQSSLKKARTVLQNHSSDEVNEDVPMFATGSSKPVSVKQSPLEKARAVLQNHRSDEVNEDVPVFATGSGKPVSVKQSSLEKARTVLQNHSGDEVNEDVPMFATGSGKPVSVKQSSLEKARAVLQNHSSDEVNEDVPMFATGSGKPVSVKRSSLAKARTVLQSYSSDEVNEDVPMFATGSGKPVSVKQSSLEKARAVLQNHSSEEASGDIPMFATGLGRPVFVKKSSLQKATAVLNSDNDQLHEDVPIFSTSSGRSVLVKKSSLQKATIVLDSHNGRSVSVDQNSILKAQALLENHNNELHQENQSTENVSFINVERTFENNRKLLSDGISRAKTLLGLDESDLPSLQLFNHENENQCKFILPENELHPESYPAEQGLSTASGRPIAVSKDALARAKNLLGDLISENETIPNEERVDREIAPKSSEMNLFGRITPGPANEMPHETGRDFGEGKDSPFASKRKPKKTSSVTPFKRPRSSRFVAPLNRSMFLAYDGSSSSSKLQTGGQKQRVSTHYPFPFQRKTIREFFGGPPLQENMDNVLDEVKQMTANNAEEFVFKSKLGFNQVGCDQLHAMLIQSGALSGQVTQQWVKNHYKWIVWKLASYERGYPSIAAGKFITVSNVLEELKYRYEREVNYGHRSVIKKILDGDVSPASMMVLCVCNINCHANSSLIKMDDKINDLRSQDPTGDGGITSRDMKIELTDGWYSIEASLDALLTTQLLSKKIFIGQKLRISGASLCGWVGPISFLEASGTVSLSLHINGTYRASWDAPLGLCKRIGPPLAFWCIRSSGGTIPLTLVGIKRIYPLLYKERLSNGGYVVRSERWETKLLQLFHQRRSNLAEEITLKSQEVSSDPNLNETCEGAKISKLIERSAEPEILMAGMTSEQLKIFSSYQAKKQDVRQNNLSKKIENALEQAGLGSRDVSTFMKVRVVGLRTKSLSGNARNKEGLITIWNPTERHKLDLIEGGIYHVTGLVPSNYGGDVLYLHAKGSSSVWKPMSSTQADNFEPFFSPRKTVQLSNLGQVPLASEFDLVAVVLLVGDVYLSGQQRRQWIFLADGSGSESESRTGEICKCILAVSFFSPVIDDDCSLGSFSKTLEGSTVGFLNLVKRARDQRKNVWVAEATDYSTYSVSTQLVNASHLRDMVSSTERWAKSSPLVMDSLKKKVLRLVNGQ